MLACVLMERGGRVMEAWGGREEMSRGRQVSLGRARRTPLPGCSVDSHKPLEKLYSGQNFVLFPYQ